MVAPSGYGMVLCEHGIHYWSIDCGVLLVFLALPKVDNLLKGLKNLWFEINGLLKNHLTVALFDIKTADGIDQLEQHLQCVTCLPTCLPVVPAHTQLIVVSLKI